MTMWQQLTDTQREQLVQEIVGAMPASGIPDHLQPGLVRYFSDGILPGGFLQAVLANDLTQAVKRVKAGAEFAITPIIDFLLAHAPSTSWGSREAVLAWTTTPDRLEIAPKKETGMRKQVVLTVDVDVETLRRRLDAVGSSLDVNYLLEVEIRSHLDDIGVRVLVSEVSEV